jgi:Ca2+-binding RTX toxin-like protein
MRLLAVVVVLLAFAVPVAAAAEPESVLIPIPSDLQCDGILYDSGNPNHHVVPSPDGVQLFNGDGQAVVDVSGAAGPQVVFGVWDEGEFPSYAFWSGNLIIGSAFDDVICSGPYSADEVYGGGGNDRIFGEAAGSFDDDLSGGPGDDVIYAGFSPNDEPIPPSFSEGCDGPDLYGNLGDDLLVGDDCVNYIFGGGGADEILGEGAWDHLSGNGGNDTMYGGDGDDNLYGGVGADVIDGDIGNDVLEGNNGADTLIGGPSSESSDPTPAAMTPWVACSETNDGDDDLYGGLGPDTIYGGDGADDIEGNDGTDTLYGECGGDDLYGGPGADTMSGGPHSDFLYGESHPDVINGDAGGDFLWGNKGADTIDGGADDDYITGDAGDDTVNGGAGDDSLYGRGGHDEIWGGDGAEYIYGGFGNDDMFDDTPASPGDGDEDYLAGDYGDDTYTSSCDDVDDTAYEAADEGENDRANSFFQDELSPTDDNFEVIFSCTP